MELFRNTSIRRINQIESIQYSLTLNYPNLCLYELHWLIERLNHIISAL